MPKFTLLTAQLLGSAALLSGSAAFAQDSTAADDRDDLIVVTGTRSGEAIAPDIHAGSLTVIDSSQIINRQVREVSEVLRDVPGVAVSVVAGQTQLRLRGAEGNHTLFLIDGIEVSDPFFGEFDVGTLIADDSAQIEILRGQQSALYGSDAIGGVVHYRTLSGEAAPGLSARIEAGSFNSFNSAARFGGKSGAFDYVVTASMVSTDGQPNARGGTRDLGSDSAAFGFVGNLQAADNLRFGIVTRYSENSGDFNGTESDPTTANFGQIIDSPGKGFENDGLYGLVKAELDLLDGRWTHRASAQFANSERRGYSGGSQNSGSIGKRLKGSYETTAKFTGGAIEHRVTFAADLERETYRNDDPSGFAFTGERSNENLGLVGLYELEAGGRASFSAAIRYDDNERFANVTTYRVQGAYLLPTGTRLQAAYGTGVKNPGFFELFGYFDGIYIGNPDLNPEKSEGWEIGVTQNFLDGRGKIGLTYFESQLEDEIYTTYLPPTFAATPANRDSLSKRDGVESWLEIDLDDSWRINGNYTYLRARENGVQEVRRPKHIGSIAIDWHLPDDKAGVTLVARYNGSQQDVAFTDPSYVPVDVRLDDYLLINLNGRVKLASNIELFGRVENLFNERYEQVFSFVSPGRSVYAGIRGQF
ncbi:TonB-dependent receptor plug domain-containing protein [Sphingorhabdus sp. 109]|jgi:vitamin B12 transporter|uniref:TonB-dependent receptor plug domain-containing protein n=1 Tax=Sphingorhabdus sp. 109 TaxID=2653173 RepID=UPI0012F43FAA|nr:TonB-dependent receptor [Sphingorhabdus sp. 109]VWX57223.1 TonB-dependent receptor [Sphingorhabdus sp. 109]